MAAPMRRAVAKGISYFYGIFKPANRGYRLSSRQYQQIRDILESEITNGQQKAVVKGWVKSVRSQKDVAFIHLNDGSCLEHLQIVGSPSLISGSLTYGSSIEVTGTLISTPKSKQSVELQAKSLKVIGTCDPVEFPLKRKAKHSNDYLRQIPHLRPRTNGFGALLRIRNAAEHAIHEFFQKEGYCSIQTPIITSNDCEGAGETFQIEVANKQQDQDNSNKTGYFGSPAYLTVSGQLHLEVISGAMSKVYTFGPTFRADNSHTRNHLAEFYMVEAELSFTESLEDIMQVMESLFKCTTEAVLRTSQKDIELFHKYVAPGQLDKVSNWLKSDFQRLSYNDAVKLLQENEAKFENRIKWGSDLNKEHERFLTSHLGNRPVFVIDFPTELKPFYAKINADAKTAGAVDLLVPDVGELFGGSLREDNYIILKQRLEKLNLLESYQWYLDLRKYGTVPHGGFGMGFERYLQCLLGISNIRDTIPFPRTASNCKM